MEHFHPHQSGSKLSKLPHSKDRSGVWFCTHFDYPLWNSRSLRFMFFGFPPTFWTSPLGQTLAQVSEDVWGHTVNWIVSVICLFGTVVALWSIVRIDKKAPRKNCRSTCTVKREFWLPDPETPDP